MSSAQLLIGRRKYGLLLRKSWCVYDYWMRVPIMVYLALQPDRTVR